VQDVDVAVDRLTAMAYARMVAAMAEHALPLKGMPPE
jgi:hypothetical protein